MNIIIDENQILKTSENVDDEATINHTYLRTSHSKPYFTENIYKIQKF